MIIFPRVPSANPRIGLAAQPVSRKPRTLIAFLAALGVVVTSAATLVSGVGVFAFDDNPAAFFRADRAARASGGSNAARASVPVRAAPAASPLQQLFGGRQLNVDVPVKARAKPNKLASVKAERKRENKPAMVAAASSHGGNDNPAGVSVSGGGSHSVCVRLCDGYHFPVGNAPGASNIAAHESICSSTCPGAPTRLFVLPAGTDDISRAYSARGGKSYSSLPVALRHSQTRDNTCSCRAQNAPQQAMVSYFRDFTLRQGDAVMTRQGFRVFRGARKWPYKANDFSALKGSSIGRSDRRMLQAIERAALPSLDTWREKPRSAPISTASPIPALGPFRVDRARIQANIATKPDTPPAAGTIQ